MVARKTDSEASAPLTFDIPESLLRDIRKFEKASGAKSASRVIRHALENFNWRGFRPKEEQHRQVSVRLPSELRKKLMDTAQNRGVSAGEIIRTALKALPDRPEKPLSEPGSIPAKKTRGSVKTKQAATKKSDPSKTEAKKTKARKAAKKSSGTHGNLARKPAPVARKSARKVARRPSL